MLSLVALQGTIWVLYIENAEIVVCFIQLLKKSCVNLILQFGYSEIFDLNRVSYRPFQTDWNMRKLICVLQHLKLSSSVECLSLEAEQQRLAVADLKKYVQMVFLNLLRVVQNCTINLLAWLKHTTLRLDYEDFVV